MILFLLNAFRLTCNVMRYVFDLFMRYPLQISLVLICLYCFWQKTRYDAIVSEFEAFRADIAQQAKIQQIKNDILRKQAEKQVKDLTEIHAHNLEAIKHEYEKTHNTDVGTIDDLRKRLLSELRDSYTMPPFATDTETNPEKWREHYATLDRQYETLKQACTITTSDFNACRSWIDTACDMVECK